MTQEEKARAYDEAIGKAQDVFHTSEVIKITDLFPQLAESEDERIIRLLRELGSLDAAKELYEEFNLSYTDVLYWLEKQKDLDKMIVVSPEVWDMAISDAYENGKKDNEKRKEQKTAEWNDSDMKEARNNLISVCRDWERGEKTTLLPVVAVRARYFLEHLTEPKCAVWSKEDKGLLLSTKCIIDEVWHSENTFGYSKEELEEIWNWLNLAWNRLEYPKENNEWSETDEKNLNEIIHFFESLCSCLATEERHAENRKWLKFLKSLRPSWKPSEVSLEALHTAVYLPEMELYGGLEDKLRILYEQLKELGVREEPEYYQHFDPDC